MLTARPPLARLLAAVVAAVVAALAHAGPVPTASVAAEAALTRAPVTAAAPSPLDLITGLLFPPPPSASLSGPRPAASSTTSPVAASTVLVSGLACGVDLFGSGWTVAPDTIATNAHVVAGVDDPVVQRPDGERLKANVVGFDPRRDVAVLRVEGLGQRPLATSTALAGTDVLVHGHPGGQEKLDVARARVRGTERALVPDIYGRSSTPHDVVNISGDIRRGDSGAAVTTYDGTAVAMIFAVDSRRPGVAYAKTSGDVAAVVGASGNAPVDTGPCMF
jgi:S1-C subfamily serine protease